MNWSNLTVIFRREVLDQLRDRRTLFMIFVFPILLYPILGFGVLKVVAANVVHDHYKAALAAKRGASQTEAIIEPTQNAPEATVADSYSAVSQRLQLEKVDKALRQVTAGKDQDRKCMIFWLRHQLGLTASEIAAIPSIGLTTEGVESVLMRLLIMIRSHIDKPYPHRNVKVRRRRNRSKRLGS